MFRPVEEPSLPSSLSKEAPSRGLLAIACSIAAVLVYLNQNFENEYSVLHGRIEDNKCNYSSQTKICAGLYKESQQKFQHITNTVLGFLILAIGAIYFFSKGLMRYSKQLQLKKAHPNHLKCAKFFKENPIYPANHISETISCPITQNNSTSPVCISFKYKTKANGKNKYIDIAHAYDYAALTEYFLQEKGGKLDPGSHVDLEDNRITDFEISFKIKKNAPEIKLPEENAPEETSKTHRM